MKNRARKILAKRNSNLNLTCVILMLLAVVLGCSDSGNPSAETPKKTIPPAYVGMWTGADGSTVTIRNDGSGDYKSGGTSVSGASVEVDEAAKEIRFSLLLIDSKYKIDEPPKNNRMKLDGMEYRRTGGFDTSAPEKDSTAKKSDHLPNDDEMQTLVGETIRNFDRAVQQGDFTDFYATIAEEWRRENTVADLNKELAMITKRKIAFQLKTDAPLKLTGWGYAQDDPNDLEVNGNYPTMRGENIPFSLRYVKENDEWKVRGISLNP